MLRERIDQLVAELRQARERGESFRFAEVAGRLALRIERAGSAQTSFVSTEERAAIEAALTAGPRAFTLGEIRISFDERRHLYSGDAGGATLLFVDVPEDPPSAAAIATWSERYAWLRANERRLCQEAALHLDALAETWSTSPAAIRAALKLSAATFYGTERVVPLLSGGEPFASHSVELELDGSGRVVRATLAG